VSAQAERSGTVSGAAPSTPTGARERASNAGWLIVGVVIALAKAVAYRPLLEHRTFVVVFVAAGLVAAMLRIQLRSVALFAGGLLALLVDPPIGPGVALWLIADAGFLALFMLIGRILPD
jgi:hypothetical protein